MALATVKRVSYGVPVSERFAEEYRFLPDGPVEKRISREVRETGRESDEMVSELEKGVLKVVSGYPMEAMARDIALYEREVAALIVGIAKKESDWGRRSPSDASGDCFNYWGYKGVGDRGVAMGYACFGSREEAIRVVGGRIEELVRVRQASDPERLIVWKCGNSCAGHDSEGVRQWISDVRIYYERVVNG